MDIEPWQLLASLGIALSLAELFTATFFALPAGLAFLATAAFALVSQDWTFLALALAVNLAIVYATFHRLVWPRIRAADTKTNADAMTGKVAVVTETIDPEAGTGEVKLYGDHWKVIADTHFDIGDKVSIVGTEGNRVVVRPLSE